MKNYHPSDWGLQLLPLLALLAAGPAGAADVEPLSTIPTIAETPVSVNPVPLTMMMAVEEALSSNPDYAGMQARARAMQTVPAQAGALPDPMLTVGMMNLPTDTYDFDQEPMTQLQIGLSQQFPFWGKRKLKKQAASAEAKAADASAVEARLQTISDVKVTWWQLYYLKRALEIVQRNQSLLRKFVDIAQTKYKVGSGLQQDVLLAQVELSKLLDKEIQLTGLQQGVLARLNKLLNRPINQPITLPEEVDTTLAEPLAEADLVEHALTHRPLLEMYQRDLEAADSKLKLAKKGYYPDINLGVAYGYRQGVDPMGNERPDFASMTLGINLPLYAGWKQGKQVDQQNEMLTKQKYVLESGRQQILANLRQLLAEYRRSREQAQLFLTGIVPQARQTVSSMLAGYQVNKVDFLNLVRAQIILYDYETQYWKAVSEANEALAKLAATAGKENLYE